MIFIEPIETFLSNMLRKTPVNNIKDIIVEIFISFGRFWCTQVSTCCESRFSIKHIVHTNNILLALIRFFFALSLFLYNKKYNYIRLFFVYISIFFHFLLRDFVFQLIILLIKSKSKGSMLWFFSLSLYVCVYWWDDHGTCHCT